MFFFLARLPLLAMDTGPVPGPLSVPFPYIMESSSKTRSRDCPVPGEERDASLSTLCSDDSLNRHVL